MALEDGSHTYDDGTCWSKCRHCLYRGNGSPYCHQHLLAICRKEVSRLIVQIQPGCTKQLLHGRHTSQSKCRRLVERGYWQERPPFEQVRWLGLNGLSGREGGGKNSGGEGGGRISGADSRGGREGRWQGRRSRRSIMEGRRRSVTFDFCFARISLRPILQIAQQTAALDIERLHRPFRSFWDAKDAVVDPPCTYGHVHLCLGEMGTNLVPGGGLPPLYLRSLPISVVKNVDALAQHFEHRSVSTAARHSELSVRARARDR